MKKGFTLIELITVIVIMAILALIITSVITNIIKDARKSSYKTSVDNLLITIKEEQLREELNNQTIYYINNGVISGDLKYDGKLNGNGFVRVDEDGKTAAKVEIENFCIYKFKDDKKSTIIDGNCGQYGGFLLDAIRVDRHSIDIFSSYDERMGRFWIKMEEEENGNESEYTQNENQNDRYYYFTGLTPGEDYYFYGKVINIHDEELTASLRVDTPNVDMPTISIENEDIWRWEKNVTIDFKEIEEDCTYEYRINYINEETETYPGGTWTSTRNEEVNLLIAKNNTQIEVRVKNANGTIIRETSVIVIKVDPTVPVMTQIGNTCYIKTGTNRDILSRYFISLASYEESQGDYTRSGHFGPSGGTNSCRINNQVVSNINELARHDNYTLTCTSTTNAGLTLSTSISLTVADYRAEFHTRVAQCAECTYDIGCAVPINNCTWVGSGLPKVAVNADNTNCFHGYGQVYKCTGGSKAGSLIPGCWYSPDYSSESYSGCTSAEATRTSCSLYYHHCEESCVMVGCQVPTTETRRNCAKCNEEPWSEWTTTTTLSEDTLTCQKRIARLDVLGNVVGERLCDNCNSASLDTCAGIEEDTCD